MYGSCVARDTIEFAGSDGIDLRGYVARQSLVSVGSDASAHLPDLTDVSSNFQARMIRADFEGSFLERIESMAHEIDVLLWDLADERHGIYRFEDGTFVTRSIDTINVASVAERLEAAQHIPFGVDEHFALWSRQVALLAEWLKQRGLFDRTIVISVPWAVVATDGTPSPWSMGIRARDANRLYARYYAELREQGFRMIELAEKTVRADPQHRWGLAPFHYSAEGYREVLRQLREHHDLPNFRERST